jgi:hypothetical protein
MQRRLADQLLDAFHAACDDHAVEVAWHLLELLERMSRFPTVLPTGSERRRPTDLSGAYERFWNLQYQANASRGKG